MRQKNRESKPCVEIPGHPLLLPGDDKGVVIPADRLFGIGGELLVPEPTDPSVAEHENHLDLRSLEDRLLAEMPGVLFTVAGGVFVAGLVSIHRCQSPPLTDS